MSRSWGFPVAPLITLLATTGCNAQPATPSAPAPTTVTVTAAASASPSAPQATTAPPRAPITATPTPKSAEPPQPEPGSADYKVTIIKYKDGTAGYVPNTAYARNWCSVDTYATICSRRAATDSEERTHATKAPMPANGILGYFTGTVTQMGKTATKEYKVEIDLVETNGTIVYRNNQGQKLCSGTLTLDGAHWVEIITTNVKIKCDDGGAWAFGLTDSGIRAFYQPPSTAYIVTGLLDRGAG